MLDFKEEIKVYKETITEEIGEDYIFTNKVVYWNVQDLKTTNIFFEYDVKKSILYLEDWEWNFLKENDVLGIKTKKYKILHKNTKNGFLWQTHELVITKI